MLWWLVLLKAVSLSLSWLLGLKMKYLFVCVLQLLCLLIIVLTNWMASHFIFFEFVVLLCQKNGIAKEGDWLFIRYNNFFLFLSPFYLLVIFTGHKHELSVKSYRVICDVDFALVISRKHSKGVFGLHISWKHFLW